MGINAQKTPFARSLHEFGDIKSQDWLDQLPQRMPVTVTKVTKTTVTVKLEGKWGKYNMPQITIPQAYSKWRREPTQVGDKGFLHSSDKYLGGQSGLGGGEADLYPRSNLTNAVFQPVSQTSFPDVDANANNISGVNGVVLMDDGKKCVFTLTPTGVVLTIGNSTVTVKDSLIKLQSGSLLAQITPTRVDLGKTGGPAVETTGGPSTIVFAAIS